MALIDMPPTREEWLSMRQSRVGASEVAALYGVQAEYQLSPWALWQVKAARAPAPIVEGPLLTWGLKLEEVIATAAAETHGWAVRRGRYAIADTCRLGASLDFEIEGEAAGPGILETKNVSWLIHKRNWTGAEPPPHILLQLQAQLLATGYSWGAVAALVGGNDLRVYPYERRPRLIADIRRRVDAFWQSIADDEPPPIDGSDGAGAVLRAMFPTLEDDAIDLTESNEWPDAVEGFLDASEAKRKAEEDYDEAKNRLAEILGGHRRGWGAGYRVSVAVTEAKPAREAVPGEIIAGRAETRRLIAKRVDGDAG